MAMKPRRKQLNWHQVLHGYPSQNGGLRQILACFLYSSFCVLASCTSDPVTQNENMIANGSVKPAPVQAKPLKIKTLDPEGKRNTTPQSVHQPNQQASDLCNAGQWRHYVGRSYEEVRTQLPKHRWKRFGYKYTEEYFQSRLNILTDADQIITKLRCG